MNTARKPVPCRESAPPYAMPANATEATGYRPAEGSVTRWSTHTPKPPIAKPTAAPIASSLTPSQSASSRPKSEWLIASIEASTRMTAIGSLTPDSPSSVRAILRRSVDPRRTANTAAASVAATVEPRISASSVLSSLKSSAAATAVMPAVSAVPTVASRTETPIAGLISAQPLDRPPSYRISASAMIAASCAMS